MCAVTLHGPGDRRVDGVEEPPVVEGTVRVDRADTGSCESDRQE